MEKHTTSCPSELSSYTKSKTYKGKKTSTAKSGAAEKIGETSYHLQSNSAVGQRILTDDDGNIHAVWTMSKSYDVAAADRGTGYNMMSSGGTWGALPDERLEGNPRTGWPNIGLTASGRLFSITHASGKGAHMTYKDAGSTTWKNKVIGSEVNDASGVWPRAAVSGNNIYVIISRQEGACSGVPAGICFYRSTDAGDTWEKIDNIDLSPYLLKLSADDYAIDARDKNIAIVVGGYASQTVLIKSTDSGDTWNYTVVTPTSNPLIPSTDAPADQTLDPVAVGGGEFTVVLDSKGTAHIAFDRLYCYKQATGIAGGPYYLPNSTAIMYWTEGMAKAEVIGKTVRQDYDGDSTAFVNSDKVQVRSYGGLVGQPSMGIDANDNIFIAYSAARDGAWEVPPGDNSAGRLYRDIYLVKRNTNNPEWVGPLNVSDNENKEDVFPSIAKQVNGTVHLIWQQDDLTGVDHQYITNDILYQGIAIDDIIDPADTLVTVPDIFMLGDLPFVLENCPINCDLFYDLHALDYPDGLFECGSANMKIPFVDSLGYWLISATDNDNNTASLGNLIPATILDDTTPPIIIAGPIDTIDGVIYSYFSYYDTMQILKGSTYIEHSAIVYDYVADTIPASIFGCGEGFLTITGTVDENKAGNYTITYDGEDINGNKALPVTRLVTVIDKDVDAPVITLFTGKTGVDSLAACGDEFVIELQSGGSWKDPGYIGFDNIDGFVEVVVSGELPNLEMPGTYTIIYTATDKAGNKIECTRLVKVADTQAPHIILAGPGSIFWPCNNIFNDMGYTAFDNFDGDITDLVIVTGIVCYTCPGTYLITYTVSDSHGNTTTVTRYILIIDDANCLGCEEPELECVDFSTGISNQNLLPQNNISIYPIPATNTINIQLNNMVGHISIEICNAAGKIVASTSQNAALNKIISIDISNQPAGVYFVQIKSTHENSIQKLLIIK